MTRLNSVGGYLTLSICHMAGMIDLAALPLWIGALMSHYGLEPQQAGLTVTAFLAAAVLASIVFAPRFTRLPHRSFAAGGFLLSAAAFAGNSVLPVGAESLPLLIVLHFLAGFGAGSALSVTHGAIGRTNNPHRLFGIVNVAMGVLAIAMFAVLPGMIASIGGPVIFRAFAITMAVAAAVSLLCFPKVEGGREEAQARIAAAGGFPRAAWFLIGAIICLALSQATVFAFVERIGVASGYGEGRVQSVLIVMGFVNLAPGILAALLQHRLPPLAVGIAGPILQAVFALSITSAAGFYFYAVPVAFYVSLVIFSHTFLFGLLARVDASGRAVAATPAMMMSGSAMGPALGGTVVMAAGYSGLAWAVMGIAATAVALLLLAQRELARRAQETAPAVA
ncbi:MFS transporter [Pannonibacter sp. Q-1]